jgi:THAP4-like, heme-binding beta-barrel domain
VGSDPYALPHPGIEHLAFLLGTWRGGGEGEYPTIDPFSYGEEIRFEHVGDPFLLYWLRSWAAEDDSPLHFERGFLRPGPEASSVEFTLAHPLGLTEVSHGSVHGTDLDLASSAMGRTASGEPVVAVVRRYRVVADQSSRIR